MKNEQDLSPLRRRWLALTIGDNYDPLVPEIARCLRSADLLVSNEKGTGYWDLLNKDPGRDFLWPEWAGKNNCGGVGLSYQRLLGMARAFRMPHSVHFQNQELLADLSKALDDLHRWSFHPGWDYPNRPLNWFWPRIGIPKLLAEITALLHEYLRPAQIAAWVEATVHFCEMDGRTYEWWSANRVWRCRTMILAGLASNREGLVELGRDALSDKAFGGSYSVFRYVTHPDGFFPDGSYIAHKTFAYTGGYGIALITDLAILLSLLHNTPWDFKDPDRLNVFRWIEDGFLPCLTHTGAMMDCVRGREIARDYYDLQVGVRAMEGILQASNLAAPHTGAKFRSHIKFCLARGSGFLKLSGNMAMIQEALRIIEDESIPSASAPVLNKVFPRMDRVIHKREHYVAAVSMHSARTANYEYITTGENIKGWFTGDGMFYLYQGSEDHYRDTFWRTVNAQRLPGTTVDTFPRKEKDGWCTLGARTWVGGVSDTVYGSAGMDMFGWGHLQARKSWFFFDREIVALGSGISSSLPRVVETIVENRIIKKPGAERLIVNGRSRGADQDAENEKVRWAHFENPEVENIGYYFPMPAILSIGRPQRTGKWSDLNADWSRVGGFPPDREPTFADHFLEMVIGHGESPRDATYQYVILPGLSAEQTQEYAARHPIKVIACTPQVHAVQLPGQGITMLHFWSAPAEPVAGIWCELPLAIMVVEDATSIRLSIADPSQIYGDYTRIRIETPTSSVMEADERFKVTRHQPFTELEFMLRWSGGRSLHIKLAKS